MPLIHTRLLVDRFAECFRFYRDLLQLKPHWGGENDSYASFSQKGESPVVLALFNRRSMSETLGTSHLPIDAPAQDRSMLIFSVDDVDATVERLKRQGVKMVREPADFADWGMRSAYLRDPDGNLVELGCELRREDWSQGLREADEKWKNRGHEENISET